MNNIKQTVISLSITLCLALTSFNAMAASKTPATQTPSAGGALPLGTAVNVVQVIEEIRPGTKRSKDPGVAAPSSQNTYRLEPAGIHFTGPVKLCMKYLPAQASVTPLETAMKSMVQEVKDANGKSSYAVDGGFINDKANSQMCVMLKSF
jgi:hypothetical protein